MNQSSDAEFNERDETPIHVCRQCSTQSTTEGEFCPHCGARYAKKKRFSRVRGASRRKKVLFGSVIGVLLLGLLAGGAALKIGHDNDVQRKKDARIAAVKKAEQARQEAAELAAEDRAFELSLRGDMIHDLERSIKKDAEESYVAGTLDDPILSASCEGEDDSYRTDPDTVKIANFSCMAVTDTGSSGDSGYIYTARINFSKGTYTWHLGRD